VGRGVQLPEFADAGALPAAHRGQNSFGRDGVSQLMGEGPAAHLGAVELKGVEPERLGSGEAVGARRGASQTFLEEVGDRLGPSGGVVTTGGSRDPQPRFPSRAGAEVIGGECIKAAAGQAKLFSGFGGRQGVLPKEASIWRMKEGA
jgi:hypothetical protein